MKVKAFWAWYDLWIGFYYDRSKRSLYFCPLPMMVFQFNFETAEQRQQRIFMDLCVKNMMERKERSEPYDE